MTDKTANGMEATPPPWRRLIIEMGPLVVFFVANLKAGIFWATGLFMVAIVISLTASYVLERRIPLMPLVGGVLIMVFGALTLILEDELFIKLKPTLVNLLFAAALFTGLTLRRNFLKIVFDAALHLNDAGWRQLTWRWAFFFVALAALNEIVWRTQTTDMWVNFKVFGIMPLTIVFTICQLPLLKRHWAEEEAAPLDQ